MRLSVLHDGFSPLQRIPITLMRWFGGDIPGPVAVMSYRRALFGRQAGPAFQAAMREARDWTPGECELFAALVSKLNHCAY